MLDLFDAPVLPGLASTSDFVTGTEEQALIAAIDAAALSPFRFQRLDRQAADGLFGLDR